METITLGGGCFWCLEAVFSKVKGVASAVSGYCGGTVASPTYHQVCSGKSGHAEVVQILFNPVVISLKELLTIFFHMHDPTTRNRQGADEGTQYRSAIFYHTAAQKEISLDVIANIRREQTWKDPIVTEVTPMEKFYPAEAYHQRYYERNPDQGYCQVVIAPKVAKIQGLAVYK